MNFQKYLLEKQKKINRIIDSNLSEKKIFDSCYGSAQSKEMLKDFSKKGKGVRGALTILSFQLFGRTENDNILKIAAGLELIHSSLLIHDDIMDKAALRRGKPSMSDQFYKLALDNKLYDPHHYGTSQSINLGDIGFFEGVRILHSGLKGLQSSEEIFEFVMRELNFVGIAQMEDVYWSHRKNHDPDIKIIEQIYKYKTSRYSFAVPLMIGAIASGQSQIIKDEISRFCEHAGLLFQIRDDELAIIYSSKNLKKDAFSDIRDNKKTIIRNILFSNCNLSELKELSKIFGKLFIDENEHKKVKNIYMQEKIQKIIKTIKNKNISAAQKIINQIDLPKNKKEYLQSLMNFCIIRES